MNVKSNSHALKEKSEPEHYIIPPKNIFVNMDLEKIQNKAQKGFSWDDLNWLMGEYENLLSKVMGGDPNLLLGPLSSEISINSSLNHKFPHTLSMLFLLSMYN